MLKNRKRDKKILKISILLTVLSFIGLSLSALKLKKSSVYDDDPQEKNQLEGKKVVFVEDENDATNADGFKGHLEAVGKISYSPSMYEKYLKRFLDIVLSFGGLVILSPVMGLIALAIKVEDPGPALFTQKRIGQNKKYFKLHKFRSMKINTPHDIPTHQLSNPEQYITKVGKFIRSHSLDELPQIWDIFIGNMSIIGPRPGLWNQDVLTAERDKYGANDIKPGLTGWAQTNGRDELEISEKAKLDGEYVKNLGIKMDAEIFFRSLHVFTKDESVVEGGTGEIKKQNIGRHYTDGKTDEELIGHIGFGEPVKLDKNKSKRILITGAGSYIGESFKKYASEHYPSLLIDEVSVKDSTWKNKDFSMYDVIFHVAGLAHSDVGNVDNEIKEKYYQVNTDLTVEVCKKAKNEGVKEFIFMSSMIVYGDSAPYGKEKIIDEYTVPKPANFYGDSKLQADVAVRNLADDTFKVIVLRPPMIYGKESKGNYPILAKLARSLPIFPDVDNERSMLHIDILSEFLSNIMMVKHFNANAIVLIPQNDKWIKTSQMVKEISNVSGNNIMVSKLLKPVVLLGGKMPGKIGTLVNKAFGNNCYCYSLSKYSGINYQHLSMKDTIVKTEGDLNDNVNSKNINRIDESNGPYNKPKALILASVASMIEQFNMENIHLLLKKGFSVDVVCNCKEGNTISDERVNCLIRKLSEINVSVKHVPIPRHISDLDLIKESYLEIKKICDENHYSLMHCHSPIGSVIARFAVNESRKKYGTKVIYTAHGFHFYKRAPKINWLIYYPIEKFCSSMTDILITINKEDYTFATKHMDANRVEFIPGVGIDTKKYIINNFDRVNKRKELGLPDNGIMILSVGELNFNKNQEIIIRALSQIGYSNIHYFIAGKGENAHRLLEEANKLGVKLHLLGYRTDIVELLNTADIFALPSYREGLSVALMEAMAAGLPCIVSNIRGNVDLIKDGKGGFLCNPENPEEFQSAIEKLIKNISLSKEMSEYNLNTIKNYDKSVVMNIMDRIYSVK